MDEDKIITPIAENENQEPAFDDPEAITVEERNSLLDANTIQKLEEEKWTLNFRTWKSDNKAHTFFKKISKYENEDLPTPMRQTFFSAGYDIAAAEDVVIPSYGKLMDKVIMAREGQEYTDGPCTLEEMAALTKKLNARPTLIPTGYKARFPGDCFLQLSIRSSSPLKYWLVLANGTGIIDADYYNNPDNEGHIMFQVINLSPYDIEIKKGEKIGQAILIPYGTFDVDLSGGMRNGGFGSTTNIGNATPQP